MGVIQRFHTQTDADQCVFTLKMILYFDALVTHYIHYTDSIPQGSGVKADHLLLFITWDLALFYLSDEKTLSLLIFRLYLTSLRGLSVLQT